MVKSNRPPEVDLENKIMKLVMKEMPGELKRAHREYQIAYSSDIEMTPSEEIRVRGFVTWFMLKYLLKEELTPYEWSLLHWKGRFSEQEVTMIRNALNHIESFFEIEKISEDKKEYVLKDLRDDAQHMVKTIDLFPAFKEKDLVQTMLVQTLAGDYFFKGNIASYTNAPRIMKMLLKWKEKASKKEKPPQGFVLSGKKEVKDKSRLLEAQHELVETFKKYFGASIVECKNAADLRKKLEEFYEWRNKNWIVPEESKTPEQLWKEKNESPVPKLQSPPIKREEDNKKATIVADTHHGIAIIPLYKELKMFFEKDYTAVPDYHGFLHHIIVQKKSPIQTFIIKKLVMQNEEKIFQIIKEDYENVETIEDMIDLFVSERSDWSDSPFHSTTTLVEDE